MRYLSSLLLVMLMAVPSFANPSFCSMTGPRNCTVQDEEELVDLTRMTIQNIQLTQGSQHAFRTQNDEVIANAQRNATQHAQLQTSNVPAYSAR